MHFPSLALVATALLARAAVDGYLLNSTHPTLSSPAT